jgi:hypothetical protein
MVDNQVSYNSRNRHRLVDAYSELVTQLMREGRDGYFINFMFNQLPGATTTHMDIMKRQVERVHSILTQHTLHDPKRKCMAHLRPIFIGSIDFPVFKKARRELNRMDVANDGMHFNVVALVQPPRGPRMSDCIPREAQQRLKVPLERHFWEKRKFYVNDLLARIDVTPVVYNTMMDYTLKAFKCGRADEDSVCVWK